METKIDQWLKAHEEEFVEDLKDYVAIPTVSVAQKGEYPFGKACADGLNYMCALAKKHGFAAENLENYGARIDFPGSVGAKTIGIWGHGDVVPALGEWERDPFTLWKNGEFYVGRGADDNKASCIGAVYAFRFLKEQGITLKNNLQLWIGSAEETGSADAVYLVKHYPMPDLSLVPDCGFPVCYGEKGILSAKAQAKLTGTNLISFTGGQADNIVAPNAEAVLRFSEDLPLEALAAEDGITVECCGDLVKVISEGIAQHSAFPQGSRDAIGQLARALTVHGCVTGNAAELVKFMGESTTTYTGEGLGIQSEDVQSGKTTHVLTLCGTTEDMLWISYNIRYCVTANSAELIAAIKEHFAAAGFEEFFVDDNPSFCREINATVKTLTEISNRILGREDQPYTLAGGTYARKIPNAMAYGFGCPGRPAHPYPAGQGGAHQPNETLYLPNVMTGIKIYILALMALDDMEGEL